MRRIKAYLSCLGCFFFLSLGAVAPSLDSLLPTLRSLEDQHFRVLVEGNNRFAFEFYQDLKSQTGNLCFSSNSILNGLGMAASGAKGKTAQQFQDTFHYSLALLLLFREMNDFLHSPHVSKNASQIFSANALWLDSSLPILPIFKNALQRNFQASLQPVDFAHRLTLSIQTINQWTAKQTQSKIHHVLLPQDVASDTQMVVTTASNVQGEWMQPFDQIKTKRLPFHLSAQRTVMTSMMQNISNYMLKKGERWDLLILPYKEGEQGSQLVMGIFLPKEGVLLNEIEDHLNWDNWKQWKQQAQMQLVALTLPRFRFEKRLNLESGLKALGLSIIFTPEADFSGITTAKNIFIDKAVHKTLIQVDEKGSGISSISRVDRKPIEEARNENPYEFIADRPFVFIIWDQKIDAILFIGRVTYP